MESAAAGSSTKRLNENESIDVKRKFVEEIDPLDEIFSKKYKRAKVYTESKRPVDPEVPSLKDTCINFLKKNLDDLKCTKGIPFHHLEPVLKFATPKQLHKIEKNNPYLIQYTNKLWEYHTKKQFRNENPGRDQMWRDVYFQFVAERKNKFNGLRLMTESNLLKNRHGLAPAPSAKLLKDKDCKKKNTNRST